MVCKTKFHTNFDCLFVCLMCLTPLSRIFQLYRGGTEVFNVNDSYCDNYLNDDSMSW